MLSAVTLGFWVNLLAVGYCLKAKRLAFDEQCHRCSIEINCTLQVGIIGQFSSDDLILLNSITDFINNDDSNSWKINLTLVDNLLPDDPDVISGWRIVNQVADNLEMSHIAVLIGPLNSISLEQIHPITVALEIKHLAPGGFQMADDERFAALYHFKEDSCLSQLNDNVKKGGIRHLTVLSALDLEDESTLSEIENFARSKKDWTAQFAFYRLPFDSSKLEVVLLEIKHHGSNATLLLANAELAFQIAEVAYRLNMTSSKGWTWYVLGDDVGVGRIYNLDPMIYSSQFSSVQSKYYSLEEGFPKGLIGARVLCSSPRLHQFDRYLANHGKQDTKRSYVSDLYSNSLLAVAEELDHSCTIRATGRSHQASSHFATKTQKRREVLGRQGDMRRPESNQKAHLKITTILERPFVYREKNANSTVLRGYCVDLVQELSRRVGFEYEMRMVADGQYGGLDPATGEWDGMIGEVNRGEANLAAGPITVTADRASVGDFLPSYMDVGLKFLVQQYLSAKPVHEYDAFAFLQPFDVTLYRAILLSVVALAAFLSLLSKLSPYGIRGKFFHSEKADTRPPAAHGQLNPAERKLRRERADAERGMGLNNALYFVWAALFWQTPERVPRSLSARLSTIVWYLAAVIFVASYTAHMVAIVSRHDPGQYAIGSMEDLLMWPNVGFGTVASSAVQTQLALSRSKMASEVYNKLTFDADSLHYLVPDVAAGVQLAKQGPYALFWDSIALDYFAAAEPDCALKTVSVGFGAVKFAFFLERDSPLYGALFDATMALKENGHLASLWHKYFAELEKCGNGHQQPVRQITLQDLAGVFYFVFISMLVGLCVLAVEWAVAVFYDVDTRDPLAPQDVHSALWRRKARLSRDIRENWFPVEQTVERWSKLTLASQEVAQEIVRIRAGREAEVKRSEVVRRSRSCER